MWLPPGKPKSALRLLSLSWGPVIKWKFAHPALVPSFASVFYKGFLAHESCAGPAPLDDDMIGASAGSMQTSEVVVAAPTPPLSAGSRGHPEFCVRPCVYMAKGGCHLGAACKYCHEAHDAYPKLDKRQRTFLQRLSAFEVLSLMQPVLAQKGQQLPLARVLDMIRTEMDRLSNNAETEEIPANKQRQIQAGT